MIAQVTAFADRCEKESGERIFYVADEMYVKSGVALPPYEKWGDFTQIENGVGMLASFEHELSVALTMLTDDDRSIVRDVSIATGEAAYRFMCEQARRVSSAIPGLTVRVYCVKNEFFGGHVTVTGLLTATDIENQLRGEELGEELILSSSTLRAEGDLFLDSRTPDDLSAALGVPVRFTDPDGAEFLWGLLGE